MTPRAFLNHATALVCSATGADPLIVRERLAQSVTVVAIEGFCDEGCVCPSCAPCCYGHDGSPVACATHDGPDHHFDAREHAAVVRESML